MAKYIDLIGYSTGTGTTFAAMTGSPYAPKTGGRLTRVFVLVARQANTSIVYGGEVVLKSPSFGGVDCQFPFQGIGEAAADIVESGAAVVASYDVDLAVRVGVNITIEYRHLATPTTPNLYVYGVFEG